MISFGHTGDFDNLKSYLTSIKKSSVHDALDKYGQQGVQALMSATPVDSSLTANSWSYDITSSNGISTISFYNSNVQNGVNIAVILQYGHATRGGSWIEGRDYINPVIRPLFDSIASAAWKEVNK